MSNPTNIKKIVIISGIALALGVAAFFIIKSIKKPCPCKGINPDEAISQMSANDLIEQIKSIKADAKTEGLNKEYLQKLLKSLI